MPRHRRSFSAELKLQVVLNYFTRSKSAAHACQRQRRQGAHAPTTQHQQPPRLPTCPNFIENLQLFRPDQLEGIGSVLPHAWIAGDNELGRSWWFRERKEQHLLAAPSNTLVFELKTPELPSPTNGRLLKATFQQVERLVRGGVGKGVADD